MTTAKMKNEMTIKSAASLYFGKVTHARLKPKIHRFNYNIFSLVIDLDRYTEAQKSSFMFGINARGIISFYEKDHGPRDGSPLRDYINILLDDGDIEKPDRILLWCNPRVFGYTFNPLSIYFCYDANDKVIALVYQVNNTFGETHSYVAKVSNQEDKSPAIRNSAQKSFYVSPFLDMNLRYDFRIQPPGDDLKVRILEHDENGPILSATFSGKHKALNSKNLVLGMLKTLGLTWKITAGIHFEALILWFKGIKLVKRPVPPTKPSYMKQESKIVAGE